MSEDFNWEISIQSAEDAYRFRRIGGLAGFVYAVIEVLLLIFHMAFNLETLATLENIELFIYLGLGLVHFLVFWLLAWRVYSRNGYISAIIMLLLFLALRIISFKLAILNILLSGFIAYAMYAGVCGTWESHKYKKEAKNKPATE